MTNLYTDFTSPKLTDRLAWYCEPTNWTIDPVAGELRVITDGETDYWQRTHYGFRRDNGHFLYTATQGDFEIETKVQYEPRAEFDQAGLMVRFSPDEWIKASVELERNQRCYLGAVVTRGGHSDWSTQEYAHATVDIGLRMRRVGDDFLVDWRAAEGDWVPLRVTHLTSPEGGGPLLAGLYAASPKHGGCTARFQCLRVSAA